MTRAAPEARHVPHLNRKRIACQHEFQNISAYRQKSPVSSIIRCFSITRYNINNRNRFPARRELRSSTKCLRNREAASPGSLSVSTEIGFS